MKIVIRVSLDCGHYQEYENAITEKYPFYCPECDWQTEGKYAWSAIARIEPEQYQLQNGRE